MMQVYGSTGGIQGAANENGGQ